MIAPAADPKEWGASPADDFDKFPHFRFSHEAQDVFKEWMTDLHKEIIPGEENPLIKQHLEKYDKLFPALALILHLVDCAADGVRGPVSRLAATRAAAWCEYLETHARRCFGLIKDDGLRSAQALVAKLEHGVLKDGFTLRDVRRNQWRSLTTDEEIHAALKMKAGCVVRTPGAHGGPPLATASTQKSWLNPTAVQHEMARTGTA